MHYASSAIYGWLLPLIVGIILIGLVSLGAVLATPPAPLQDIDCRLYDNALGETVVEYRHNNALTQIRNSSIVAILYPPQGRTTIWFSGGQLYSGFTAEQFDKAMADYVATKQEGNK